VTYRKNTLGCTGLAVAMAMAMAIGMPAPASAQETDGAIAGTAIAGQTILLRGDNGIQRKIQFEKTGKFSIRHLPVGTYEVTRTDANGNIQLQTAIVLVNKTTRIE
jgi:hypothetical protein